MGWRNHGPIETRPGGPLEPLVKFVRELDANAPILNGRLVRLSWEASGSVFVATAEHGLGRPYVGALIVGVSTQTRDFVVYAPDALPAAYDPAEVVYATQRNYGTITTAVAAYVDAWVF